MTKTIIGLGCNLPSAKGGLISTLKRALEFLSSEYRVSVECVSDFYKTPAFPAGAGPDFANAAALIHGNSTPSEMLECLHQTEAAFGRDRSVRWGPRVLDLDLLAMGDTVLPDGETLRHLMAQDPDQSDAAAPGQLILPHPRLQDRAFVLVPMADVAPDWSHPILGATVLEMRDALPPQALAEVTPWEGPHEG